MLCTHTHTYNVALSSTSSTVTHTGPGTGFITTSTVQHGHRWRRRIITWHSRAGEVITITAAASTMSTTIVGSATVVWHGWWGTIPSTRTYRTATPDESGIKMEAFLVLEWCAGRRGRRTTWNGAKYDEKKMKLNRWVHDRKREHRDREVCF